MLSDGLFPQNEDEEHQEDLSRTGSSFRRVTSADLPPESPQQEQTEAPRRSASYHAPDRSDVPPLAIAMLVCGTRGDVQPFLALALGLQKDGHRVRLATHAIFKDYVESYGIEFFPLGQLLHTSCSTFIVASHTESVLPLTAVTSEGDVIVAGGDPQQLSAYMVRSCSPTWPLQDTTNAC